MMRKANFHLSLLLFIACLFGLPNQIYTQDQNDYYNCLENYDEILCIPQINVTLNNYVSDQTTSDVKLSFAVESGNLEYYVFSQIVDDAFVEQRFYFTCEFIEDPGQANLEESILCTSNLFTNEWFCGELGSGNIINFDVDAYDYIEIWNESQLLPNCPSSSDLDPCSPCILNTDCVDPDLIDDNMFCTTLYDPVCGCDSITYQNACYARYKYGITEFEEGPCNKNTCIDSSLIDDNMFCTTLYDPVCGCDGNTYPNECIAKYYYGILSYTAGECNQLECVDTSAISDIICIQLYDPVCGCDGVTYPNECYATASGVKSWTKGECGKDNCIDEDLIDPTTICPALYQPVCGCDNVTYSNECYALRNGVINYVDGECPELDCDSLIFVPLPIIGDPDSGIAQDSCEQYGYDPVCGCDGIDYDNSCFAFYNGVEYYTIGLCSEDTLCYADPVDIDFCIELYDPVCGCDGQEYDNSCEAIRAGIIDWTPGNCECQLTANIIYRSEPGQTVVDLIVENGPVGYTYIWQYKKKSSSIWLNAGTTSFPTIRVTGLEECEDYEWRVEIICDNNVSNGLSSVFEFTTECDQGCQIPQIVEYGSTPREMDADLFLENISGDYVFRWEYKRKVDSNWLFAGSTNTPGITIVGLEACTDYEWRVEIICDNNVSNGLSSVFEFTTECDQGCQIPQIVEYSSLPREMDADLFVENISGGYVFRWEYKKESDSNWLFAGSTNTPGITIAGLEACTDYEWRVEILCNTGESAGVSSIQEFKTECDAGCQLPQNIEYGSIPDKNTATLFVLNGSTDYTYNWEYRNKNGSSWLFAGSTNTPGITISNLVACEDYEWRVEIFCENGDSAGTSTVQEFTTECVSCPIPADLQFNITPYATEVEVEFSISLTNIDILWEFKFSDENVWIFAGDTKDSKIILAQLDECTSYDLRVQIRCEDGSLSEKSEITSFETECLDCVIESEDSLRSEIISETEVKLELNSNLTVSTVQWQYRKIDSPDWSDVIVSTDKFLLIESLEACTSYEWRAKIICEFGQSSSFSENKEFTTTCLNCDLPEDIQFESELAGDSEVMLIASNNNVVATYEWEFRIVGESDWNSAGVSINNFITLDGLDECQEYEWRVKINCTDNLESEFSNVQVFNTNCDECIDILTIENELLELSQESFEIELQNLPQDVEVIWQFKLFDDQFWTFAGSGQSTSNQFNNLLPCTKYEWRVEIICDNGISSGQSMPKEVTTECTECQNVNSIGTEVLSEGIDFIELKVDNITVQNPYFIWKYRKVGALNWINVISGNDETILIENLNRCTAYEYYLEVYCEDGDIVESEINESMTSCITDVTSINAVSEINVFPNPFKDEIFIDTGENEFSDLNYVLYSIDGRIINSGRLSDQYKIATEQSLEGGVYILNLYNQEFYRSFKLIKI